MSLVFQLVILLSWIQVLHIPAGSSIINLSNIILYLTAPLLLTSRRINRSQILVLLFIFTSGLIGIANDIPIRRIVSGSVAFGVFLFIAWSLDGFALRKNRKHLLYLMLYMGIFTALIIILQYYFFDIERPSALMLEPSQAGLFLLSCVPISYYLQTSNSLRFVVISTLFVAILITKTTQILTFLIFIMVIFLCRFLQFRKSALSISIYSLFVCLGLYFLIPDDTLGHYTARLEGFQTLDNLSVLAWMRGFDHSIQVFLQAKFWGFGAGSAGYFDYYGKYDQILNTLDWYSLNLHDYFSGFFRILAEFGLVGSLLVLNMCRISFKNFYNTKDEDVQAVSAVCFLLLLGSLLKEPVYTMSNYALIAIFFLMSRTQVNSND
jgi:hypothetical protein